MRITTVAITGDTNNELKFNADFSITIPSKDTPRIQECMMLIGHTICCLIEKKMFGQ